MPSYIEIDISELEIGDTLTRIDLPTIEGVEYLDDDDRPLVTVLAPRLIEEEEVVDELEGELAEGEEAPEEGEAAESAEAEDEG